MEKICVAVRVRPPVSHETSGGVFWKVEDNRVSLHRQHDTPVSGTSYAFGNNCLHLSRLVIWPDLVLHLSLYLSVHVCADHVFDETCSNARVYELLTKDIIHAAVEGFNGSFSCFFFSVYIWILNFEFWILSLFFSFVGYTVD